AGSYFWKQLVIPRGEIEGEIDLRDPRYPVLLAMRDANIAQIRRRRGTVGCGQNIHERERGVERVASRHSDLPHDVNRSIGWDLQPFGFVVDRTFRQLRDKNNISRPNLGQALQ